MPCSTIVGISGAAGTRCALPTPIARSAPLFRCCCTDGSAAVHQSTWPPMVSVIIGPTPLYGMWFALPAPASSMNISAARCRIVPLPDEP